MKSAAKTPGKLLAGLCLILFFCLMPVRSYAAEQQLSEITKLYVTGIYGSETLPQQKVNWQYADKGYYLCMPSGADLSNVQLHFTENSDGNENADSYVMIGGQKINCGDSTDLSGTSKLQISLAGGKSVSVNRQRFRQCLSRQHPVRSIRFMQAKIIKKKVQWHLSKQTAA